jgi:hypothetical protein
MNSAKAPSGTVRADSVPTAHRTLTFSSELTALRASVVLPTPASPMSTTPATSPLVEVSA